MVNKGVVKPSNEKVWREVIKSSGRTNSSLRYLNKTTKVLGPIGLAYGIYNSYHVVKEDKYSYESLVGEATAIIGGFAGFDIGMIIGAAVVVGVASLLAITAPAWAILGGAIAGGALLGMGMAWIGRKVGRSLGKWFD